MLADEVVVLLPLGIATTRVVNFINDELWGKICDPDQPWCIKFPAVDGYRHPSQIYEGILDILAVPLLLWLVRKRPADGVVAWTWFTYYGITRTVAEIWREPGFTVIGLSGGQLVALPMVFIGAALLYRRDPARPPHRRSTAAGRCRHPTGARDSRSLHRRSTSMALASTIGERVATLRARVDRVAEAAGRSAGTVAILGVTKTQPRDGGARRRSRPVSPTSAKTMSRKRARSTSTCRR